MDFNGYIEEPVYNEDNSVAYIQYAMKWGENDESRQN